MIKSEKITLRPLRSEDWENTIHWRNDLKLTKQVMSHPFPITDLLEKEWFNHILIDKSNRNIYFGIEQKQNSKLIGIIFLTQINWISKNCYLGILIGDNSNRGKGYGTEAVKLITDYAFNVLNLNKITLEVVDQNDAIKLYNKLGFHSEGLLKNHYYFNNDYFDIHILSLFR